LAISSLKYSTSRWASDLSTMACTRLRRRPSVCGEL